MTNEQINIAIFEIFGWKWEPEKDSFLHPENGRLKPKYAPDYCKDLNAMHEAEIILTADQWYKYDSMMPLRDPQKIHATAKQRAEAFLKTIGKWEETSSD
jgi:hypothetical protein